MAITKTKTKTLDKTKSKTLVKTGTKTKSSSFDKYKSLLKIKSKTKTKSKSKYKHQITDKTVTKEEYNIVSKYIDLCHKCGPDMVFNKKTNMCIDRYSIEARKLKYAIQFCNSYFSKKLNSHDKKIIDYLLDYTLPFIKNNKPLTLRSLIPKEYQKHMNNTTIMYIGAILLKLLSEHPDIKPWVKQLFIKLGHSDIAFASDKLFDLLNIIQLGSLMKLALKPFIVIFGLVSTLFIKLQQKHIKKSDDNKEKINFVPGRKENILNSTTYNKNFIRSTKGLIPNDDDHIIFDFLNHKKAYTDNNADEIDLAKIGLKCPMFIKLDFKFYYFRTGKTAQVNIKFKDPEFKAERFITISEDPNKLIPKIKKDFTERNDIYKEEYNKLVENLENLSNIIENQKHYNEIQDEIIKQTIYLNKFVEQGNQHKVDTKLIEIENLQEKLNIFSFDKSAINKKILPKDNEKLSQSILTNYTTNINNLKKRLKEITNLIEKINETNYIALRYIINNEFYIIDFFYSQNTQYLYNFTGKELLEYLEFKEQNSDPDEQRKKKNYEEMMKTQYEIMKNNKKLHQPQKFIAYPKSPVKSKSPDKNKSPIKEDLNNTERILKTFEQIKDVNGKIFDYNLHKNLYSKKYPHIKGKTFDELYNNKDVAYDPEQIEFVKKEKLKKS